MTLTTETAPANGHLYLVVFDRLPSETTAENLRDALVPRMMDSSAGHWDVIATKNDGGTVGFLLAWDRSDPEADYHRHFCSGGHNGTPDAARVQLQNELDYAADRTADLPLTPYVTVAQAAPNTSISQENLRAWGSANTPLDLGWETHPTVWQN